MNTLNITTQVAAFDFINDTYGATLGALSVHFAPELLGGEMEEHTFVVTVWSHEVVLNGVDMDSIVSQIEAL